MMILSTGQVFRQKMPEYSLAQALLITLMAAPNRSTSRHLKARLNQYLKTQAEIAVNRGVKFANKELVMNISGKLSQLAITFAVLVTLSAAADMEIDPNWHRFSTQIDFIDSPARLMVAGDRQFTVPFNTPIYSHTGKSTAISNLREDDKIWLYLKKSGENGFQVKRIEQIK